MNQSYSYQNPLHEPIDVDVTFSRSYPGHCRPIAFRTSTGGLKTIFAFDITDGSTDYRITLDSESLCWYLEFEGDQYV